MVVDVQYTLVTSVAIHVGASSNWASVVADHHAHLCVLTRLDSSDEHVIAFFGPVPSQY